MKKLILIGVIVCLCYPSFSLAKENDIVDGIKINCAAEWEDDFFMQKDCFNRQIDSYNFMIGFKRDLSEGMKEVGEKIINKCLNEWPGQKKDFNYFMVEDCSKRQMKAYMELNLNDSKH